MIEPTQDTAEIAFAVAILSDDRLLLRAQTNPQAVAADYGLTLTEEQVSRIKCLQPEAVERIRKQLAFWPWEGGSFW